MENKVTIFQEIYQNYMKQISLLDLRAIAQKADVEWSRDSLFLPLFGKPHKISKNKILDPSGKEPNHSVKVVLCKYLLLYPFSYPKDDTLVSYKDFPDAAPFVHAFHNNAEMNIAKTFSGRLNALREACLKLGGCKPSINWAYHLQMKFDALPKIPILLLFNDADDEFPAQCLLLFERRAEKYLDMECLAILGWLLAGYLCELLENTPVRDRDV